MKAMKINFEEVEQEMDVKVDTISPEGNFVEENKTISTNASPIQVEQSNSVHVKEMAVDEFNNVEPLPLPQIKDINGKYTNVISEAEVKYNCPVLPLEVLNIPKVIVGFANHDIIMIHGKKFTSNNCSTSRPQVIRDYANQLIEKIFTEVPVPPYTLIDGYNFTGKEFVIELMQVIQINGIPYKTRLFNNYEIRQLKSYLRGVADVKFLTTDLGDLFILLTPKDNF